MRRAFPFFLLLAGLILLLLPCIANHRTLQAQHQALNGYRDALSRMDEGTRSSLLIAAEAANDASLLAVDQSGIIGIVAIPALQTTLPIYLGTSETILTKGAGLLEGSSPPIGGCGHHTVLSAHRGLPEARLFRDLDRLVPGDTFTVTVLGQDLTYQVDQILVTLPSDTSALMPREGEDLCTLLTCTPYGINSHRLLVRGKRLPTPAL
jgi:sortase A